MERCVEEARLPSHMADASAVHEAQNRTLHLSEQACNRAGARLAAIFAQCHVTPPLKLIFPPPMIAVQLQESLGRSLRHRKVTDPVDDLVPDLARFEDRCGAFEPKHLCHPLLCFGKPVLDCRDGALFESPMGFVPRFGLLPSPPIWRTICKQIGEIFP